MKEKFSEEVHPFQLKQIKSEVRTFNSFGDRGLFVKAVPVETGETCQLRWLVFFKYFRK